MGTSIHSGKQPVSGNWIAPEYERVQVVLDSILPLDELRERGRQQALKSGTDRRLPDDEKSLTDYARSIALDTHLENFDPLKNPQDKLRQDEHTKEGGELDLARKAEKVAFNEVLVYDNELAKLKRNLQEPFLSPWIVFFAVSALVLSFAPTFHDRFFSTLGSSLSAWTWSVLASIFIGAFITWTQLGFIDKASGKRTPANWAGLVSGIGIGVAAGILRASDAQGWREYLFAAGLTLFEVSTVVCIEWVASKLRSEYQEWTAYAQELNRAKETLEAAQRVLAARREALKELENRIQAFIAYVESRWVRATKVKDIEAAAVSAILHGYQAGVAENAGKLIGLNLVKRA